MKPQYKKLATILLLGFLIIGCYEDVISPERDPDGPAQSVSFKNDLAPLLNAKCTAVGCHVNGGHKPYMDDVSLSFRNITSGGFVNTLLPKESILYKQVNGSMSEYIPSKADKQLIYDWIRNGAPNN